MTSPSSKSSPSARSSQASSPAGSGLGSSHGALPPTPVSPFFGNYPNAPHLRPIALPEMTPAMAAQMSLAPTPAPGYARTATPGPAPTPGSHSRGMSLPSPFSGPGSMLCKWKRFRVLLISKYFGLIWVLFSFDSQLGCPPPHHPPTSISSPCTRFFEATMVHPPSITMLSSSPTSATPLPCTTQLFSCTIATSTRQRSTHHAILFQ